MVVDTFVGDIQKALLSSGLSKSYRYEFPLPPVGRFCKVTEYPQPSYE